MPEVLQAANRTNLELKLACSKSSAHFAICYQSHQSGIETSVGLCWVWHFAPTNRTNLELKPSYWKYNINRRCSTNRTNLELKPLNMQITRFQWITTNRTNLELKPIFEEEPLRVHPLPIAPIWN